MTELLATEMRRLMHDEYERKYRIEVHEGDRIVSTYASVPAYFLLDFRDLQTTPIPSIHSGTKELMTPNGTMLIDVG